MEEPHLVLQRPILRRRTLRNGFRQEPMGSAPRADRTIIRLAFLAPDIQQRIVDGRQPAGLCLDDLRRAPIPLCWDDQRRLIEV